MLKLALIHLNVVYKDPETNRAHLLALSTEAARNGADVILNPEMAVSGYSFRSRQDVAPYAETTNGKTLTALAQIAQQYRTYIGVGLAECDEATGIYYNSAFVVDPAGRQICRYRKINGEMRWACPGDPKQHGIFETPWGRMGIMICSDTYYGLLPRTMALRDVDLVLVTANWPPGGLDPRELWQARALENGCYLAACNRTGKDRIMDCSQAVSCVYDPQGNELLSASSEASQVLQVEIPFNDDGKLSHTLRRQALSTRNPAWYRSIYLDFRLVDNLTEHYELPEPGELSVHCLVPGEDGHAILNTSATLSINSVEGLAKRIEACQPDTPALFVLPALCSSALNIESFEMLAKRFGMALCLTLRNEHLPTPAPSQEGNKSLPFKEFPSWEGAGVGLRNSDDNSIEYIFIAPEGVRRFNSEHEEQNSERPFPIIQFGPANITMTTFESFRHPELAVTFAKQGCDLVVLSEDVLTPQKRLLAGVKTVEGLSVALCASNGATICMKPEGHARWKEEYVDGAGVCSYRVDTTSTRKKRFQDRVDFDLLLR